MKGLSLQLSFRQVTEDNFDQMRRVAHAPGAINEILSKPVSSAQWDALANDYKPSGTPTLPQGVTTNSTISPGTQSSYYSAGTYSISNSSGPNVQEIARRMSNAVKQNDPWVAEKPEQQEENGAVKKGMIAKFFGNPIVQELVVFGGIVACKIGLWYFYRKAQQKGLNLPE